MDQDVTLATLIRDHPEWADRPLVVMNGEGIYEYIGAEIYTDFDQDENLDVLVIAGN